MKAGPNTHSPASRRFAKEFGDMLRTLRKSYKLTQLQMAMRTGICLDTYTRIEQGRSTISVDTLIKVSIGLKVPAWELMKMYQEDHEGDR